MHVDRDGSDGNYQLSHSSDRLAKSIRACTHCRSLKIRCKWVANEGICIKCKATGTHCVPHDPKKSGPCSDLTQLRMRSDAQDARIRSILSQLEGRRQLAKLQPLVAAAHTEASGCMGKRQNNDKGKSRLLDYASPNPSPSVVISPSETEAVRPVFLPYYTTVDFAKLKCPQILMCGLFGPAEVTALFGLYFEYLYPSFPILDPALHTPEYLLPRSPLLFTTILYIATRLWTHRPKLHRLAQEHVIECIKEAMGEGPRNIETCQSFAILSLYPAPHENYIDCRSSMFIELATRIAQDLRLDEPPPAELPEREKLSRLRTWFEVMTASSFDAIRGGRPAPSPRNNFPLQMSGAWYHCSPLNSPYDFYTSAYADLLLFGANIWGPMGPTGLDAVEDRDVSPTVLGYHQRVCDRIEMWERRRQEQSIDPTVVAFRDPKLHMLGSALRLVVLGVGIQHTLKRNMPPERELLNLSLEAAKRVLEYGLEGVYPTGFLRYVTEPQYLYVTYSAAFLINLLRPRLISLLDPSIHANIIQEVRRLIEVLSSKEVALDRAHIAVVYAGFLGALLEKVSVGQGLTHDSLSRTTCQTAAISPRISTHMAISQGHGDSDYMSLGPSCGLNFTINQFAADVTLHGSEAYPVPPRGNWYEFPLDTGTW